VSTPSPYRTQAPDVGALQIATLRLVATGRVRAALQHGRLTIRERPAIGIVVATAIGGVLVTLAGVFAAWMPVQVVGLVLGPLLLLAALANLWLARIVIDPQRVHGRDAAKRAVDCACSALACVRFECEVDSGGVDVVLSLVPREGDPIVLLDALAFDRGDGRELAHRVRAFGLGIAAWLGLDFQARQQEEGPPSATLVRAGEALDVLLGLLQA